MMISLLTYGCTPGLDGIPSKLSNHRLVMRGILDNNNNNNNNNNNFKAHLSNYTMKSTQQNVGGDRLNKG